MHSDSHEPYLSAASQSEASGPRPFAGGTDTATARRRREHELWRLKARLQLFLYRHPVVGLLRIMDVIDNAETTGEIKLLLDHILDLRVHALATRRHGLPQGSSIP